MDVILRSDWVPAVIMAALALGYLSYVMWRLYVEQRRSARLRAYIKRRGHPDGRRAAEEILEQSRQRIQERRRRRS